MDAAVSVFNESGNSSISSYSSVPGLAASNAAQTQTERLFPRGAEQRRSPGSCRGAPRPCLPSLRAHLRRDRAWLGLPGLATFQAGKEGAGGKQPLMELPERPWCVNHPAGSQPRKSLQADLQQEEILWCILSFPHADNRW